MKFRTNPIQTAAAFVAALSLSALTVGAGPLKKSEKQLNKKIGAAQERLEALQAKPKKAIPKAILAKAHGIIIMKNLKAGLGVGVAAGGGIAMVKEKGTDNWKAPAFVRAAEASWGLQIGAQKSDIIIVLMSEKSLSFLKPLGSTGVGVEVDAAVGPVDIGEEFDSDTLKSHVLVYSDAAGAFAGATIKAGGIIGAQLNNKSYYTASLQDILFGKEKVEITPQGQMLIDSVEKAAGKKKAAAKAK